ncbi:MAG: hypothetical protein IMZ43_01495 [Thermoplasmata archaeon]|nr:hypothetical protein [Thermoplasmata archaeon]
MKPTQKHTSTKAILLALLVLFGIIVSPVCAANYTTTGTFLVATSEQRFQNVNNVSYNVAGIGHRINLIEFSVSSGSYANLTLYYGANLTVEGSAENHLSGITLCAYGIPCPQTVSTLTFNGVSKSYYYGDIQPFYDFDFAGYARDVNNDTGFLLYGLGYGSYLDNDLAVFYPVSNIGSNLIYRVDITSPTPFEISILHGKASDIASSVSKSWLDVMWEWINLAISLAFFVKDTAIALFYWLKFFFWDNLTMTVALYISISMAYSANTSKDIFKFLGKFFNDQKKLFEFILSLWTTLVNLVAQFRSIFHL